MDNSTLQPGQYQVLLREIPKVLGETKPNHYFTLAARQALGVVEQHFKFPDIDPITNQTGYWLKGADAKKCRSKGLKMLDQFEFIVRHVEMILRSNLISFLSIQDVDNLLQEWIDSDLAPKLSEYALTLKQNTNSLIWATYLLQSLVQEKVPLTHPERILTGLQSAEGETNPSDAIARLRLYLKDDLPGNQLYWQHLRLSSELEDRLLHSFSVQFPEASPSEISEMTAKLQTSIKQHYQTEKVALVVSNSQLRSIFIKHITVLSLEELITPIALDYENFLVIDCE